MYKQKTNRKFLESFSAEQIEKRNRGKHHIDRHDLNNEINKFLKLGKKIKKIDSNNLNCFGDEIVDKYRYE